MNFRLKTNLLIVLGTKWKISGKFHHIRTVGLGLKFNYSTLAVLLNNSFFKFFNLSVFKHKSHNFCHVNLIASVALFI